MVAPAVALLTDFGTLDPYVGIMKGVMRGLGYPGPFLDLTHHIPAGDIARAAFVLWQSREAFPPETVFLVVVDPGVGTARRALRVDIPPHRFIAPDNGVLTYLLHLAPHARAWELREPAYQRAQVSTTFHGRDIFAPAAAHSALGVPGPAFGPEVPLSALVRIPIPRCHGDATRVEGEVLHADRFGNVLTSIGRLVPQAEGWRLEPWLRQGPPRAYGSPRGVELPDGRWLPLVRTFGDVPEGEAAALVGSTGLVELIVNRGSAAEALGLPRGARVTLHLEARA
ncbi:MAG: SAM-dependent chlorinase/fluorinase [Chloroflexi bacterium]|nr:SAM-dependent chlorinase/fluorinase [Chloroflexota bacterium]